MTTRWSKHFNVSCKDGCRLHTSERLIGYALCTLMELDALLELVKRAWALDVALQREPSEAGEAELCELEVRVRELTPAPKEFPGYMGPGLNFANLDDAFRYWRTRAAGNERVDVTFPGGGIRAEGDLWHE